MTFENQFYLKEKDTGFLDKKLDTIGLDAKQKNAHPTRLPTPKRPVLKLSHKSADHLIYTNNNIQENTSNNKPPTIQSDPPSPASPGKRVRHSSIARLVKVPTRPSDDDKKEQTRIPLPNNRHSVSINNSSDIDQQQTPSKLKQPEVKVPESIKKLQRRPIEVTANLVSALGVISQPEEAAKDESFDRIHDRLQNLVDARTSSELEHVENSVIDDIHQHDANAMNAQDALNQYRNILSSFERVEIQRFTNIYFVGQEAKKIQASTDEPQQNFGYDDEKGDYQVRIKDQLIYRYEILETLGKGSFGQVLKCRDHKSDSIVAVKIIRNKKKFLTQAETEVKILEQLVKWDPKNKHYNVRMFNSFLFRNHLCIVFECLSLNLYDILQQNGFQGFSLNLVRRFAYQILTALKLLHRHNVIHCDLKPENILLKRPDRSGIRVIDYGSSCYTNEKVFTYIQSRFYRAPEVILGLDYGLPIDMWSTGCILAELYTGHPLFPGENEPDQLACIMQLLGPPKKEYLDQCSRKKQFFDSNYQPRKPPNSKREKKRKPNSLSFTDALKRSTYDNCDRDFVDFISRCMTWEPEKRIKPEEALTHPWIQAMKK